MQMIERQEEQDLVVARLVTTDGQPVSTEPLLFQLRAQVAGSKLGW